MTRRKRIEEFIIGVLMILFAMFVLMYPDDGAGIIILIMSISLLLYGLKLLFYFLTMARNMNGGESVLYRSIVILDLGIFAMAVASIPQMYVMMYLLGYNLFMGIVDVLRALETRKIASAGWKFRFVLGLITCVVSVSGWFNIGSTDLFVTIYSTGLISSAAGRIVGAFKKTSVVYIQ